MDYPARGYLVRHPHDSSLQTFRGHSVTQTLIRAYFSPLATTAQRYVYAGSADGAVRIWGTPRARRRAPRICSHYTLSLRKGAATFLKRFHTRASQRRQAMQAMQPRSCAAGACGT
jgi:hypothetical protein